MHALVNPEADFLVLTKRTMQEFGFGAKVALLWPLCTTMIGRSRSVFASGAEAARKPIK